MGPGGGDVQRKLLGYLLIGLVVVIISRVTVYGAVLLIWYLGYLLLRAVRIDVDFLTSISIAPAVGFTTIVLLIHALSWLRWPLSAGYWFVALIVVLLSLTDDYYLYQKPPKSSVYGMLLGVSLSLLPKLPFFNIPAYPGAVGHDAIFHAYKAFEIIKEDTVFIKHYPPGFKGILHYPAGYHSIVAFLSLASGSNVPNAMLALKVFTWILIPLGTFAAS
ncbi:hypothetical protein [Thermococcus prieurii]